MFIISATLNLFMIMMHVHCVNSAFLSMFLAFASCW